MDPRSPPWFSAIRAGYAVRPESSPPKSGPELRDDNGGSIHHDLHAVPRLHLGMRVEPVQNPKALRRAIAAGHAVGERFHGVAGLHGDDLDAQRPGGLDFLQRQPAERVYGLAGVALAFGGLLPGGKNEAVDVTAEAQRID